MTPGISRTQLVLLRGSLRCLVVFAPLSLLLQIAVWWDGVLSWNAEVDDADVRSSTLNMTEGTHAYGDGNIRIDLENPSFSVWLAAVVPTTIVAATVTVVAAVLLKLLHQTHAGEPFFDASARRLRLVARLIAAAAILVPITRSIANTEIVHAAMPQADASASLDVVQMVTWLVVALIVRVIAEAFRIGTQLRADTEGLV